jgi:hypothetical protein
MESVITSSGNVNVWIPWPPPRRKQLPPGSTSSGWAKLTLVPIWPFAPVAPDADAMRPRAPRPPRIHTISSTALYLSWRFEWFEIGSTERLHLLEGNDDLAWRRRMVSVEEKSLTGARKESLSMNNTHQVDKLSSWLQDRGVIRSTRGESCYVGRVTFCEYRQNRKCFPLCPVIRARYELLFRGCRLIPEFPSDPFGPTNISVAGHVLDGFPEKTRHLKW